MNKFDIKVQGNDPYGALIESAIKMSFPNISSMDGKQVLDAVTSELVGTSQIRFGPAPNPESLVAIRSVIRNAIHDGRPIPILVPWGSKKTDSTRSVDIAELCAIKTLNCLNTRICNFYPAGAVFAVRLEDLSGYYLFEDEGEVARKSSVKYCNDFVNLIYALELNSVINPIKETDLCEETVFNATCDFFQPMLLEYLQESDKNGIEKSVEMLSYQKLLKSGWVGTIPLEQRSYYYSRYEKVYHANFETQQIKLSRYLAASISRYKLGMKGNPQHWGSDFIYLAFVPAVPGIPESLVSKRLYYRAIHAKYTRDHVIPWRGRGYLRIFNDNTVTPAIASFGVEQEYIKSEVEISGRHGTKATLMIDYVLK